MCMEKYTHLGVKRNLNIQFESLHIIKIEKHCSRKSFLNSRESLTTKSSTFGGAELNFGIGNVLPRSPLKKVSPLEMISHTYYGGHKTE